MATQDFTFEIEDIMKGYLAHLGHEAPDNRGWSIGEMLQVSMGLEEASRAELMARIISRLDGQTEPVEPEPALGEIEAFGDEDPLEWEDVERSLEAIDWATTIGRGYLEPADLVTDEDVERLIARQKEMMDTVFGGIGEETKPQKRQGLAMQQLQLEQQQALRLILGFTSLPELIVHLQSCLDSPDYGYGERGSNGRVIAQGLQAVAEDEMVDFEAVVAAWWQNADDFRRRVMAGTPFSMRPLFDETTLETFLPVLCRVGDTSWQLGASGRGKSQTFEGELFDLWGEIGDALVQWTEGENDDWLTGLKQQAGRLPFDIQRPAQADRLRKERITVSPRTDRRNELEIHVARLKQEDAWPRFLTIGERAGISRLNGHGFYEVAWEGGEKSRRFELSDTTRNRIPVEHTEIALAMGEVLAGDGLRPEPASPEEIEAAYLRRMKATGVKLGPPPAVSPLDGIDSVPAATYTVASKTGSDIEVVFLSGGEVIACAVVNGEAAVVLREDDRAGLIIAHPVRRGRIRRTTSLLSTPLAGVEKNAIWVRALGAWGAWLTQALG